MSEAFLTQILSTDSSVQADHGQLCCICLQLCGTLSRESGVVEVEVRLPCNHTVGSACIARWLQANNTCPLCHETFFPREHQPHAQPLVIDRRESMDEDSSDDEGWDVMTTALHLWMHCCTTLRLRDSIINLVQRMLIKANSLELDLLSEFSPEGATVACIYMATHLLRQPKTLRAIGRVANVEERYYREAYRGVYTYRRELIEENWVQEHGDLESAFSLLPPPGSP